jgi:hypothetical protein
MIAGWASRDTFSDEISGLTTMPSLPAQTLIDHEM